MPVLPVIRGTIERRFLVNYRIDPAAARRIIPEPFNPQLHNGFAIGGICLIRLAGIGPRGWPRSLGIRSENAAHRFAVEWEEEGQTRTGVYIPRRDTSSVLNVLAGGSLFPGVHHHARFDVEEADESFRLEMRSDDGSTRVRLMATLAAELPAASGFSSVEEASQFFECGSLGYSDREEGGFDGLELRTMTWAVEPLTVQQVTSSFFDALVEARAATFDHALIMRDIEHEWHGRESLCC